MYLKWNEKTITDFGSENINSLYNEGYVFTRIGKGVMHQTRRSENRRILKKIEGLDLNITKLPIQNYHWSIGKMAKDFYESKFGQGTFSANKIKELLTDESKSNFNTLFAYLLNKEEIGHTICHTTNKLLHYSYPFYQLDKSGLGMGMMIMAIVAAKENGFEYIYLGSAQRPTDKYKLQFSGLEWFDGKNWSEDLDELKQQLKQITQSKQIKKI
jgi:arginyl-tRNA--protein-N-Asp/Glu arginylyltransferase